MAERTTGRAGSSSSGYIKPDFAEQGVIAAPIAAYGVIFFAVCSPGGGDCRAYLFKNAETGAAP